MRKSKFKSTKGITLIALVVTIIVLLILAGISIAMLTGRNGVLSRAGEARYVNEIAEFEEKVRLAQISLQAEIANKSRVNPGYIATEEPNFSALAGSVASEMGVTAIQGGSSANTGATKVAKVTSRSGATRGSTGVKINTEGYTVSYYLDTPGSDTTDGTGYIVVWYTNNSLRSSIDRDEVIDKYGLTDVADASNSRNQLVLVKVITIENYGCALSDTGLTSATDGDNDIKETKFDDTTIKEQGLKLASSSSSSGSGTGTGGGTGSGESGSGTGGTSTEPTVTIGGQTITLTPENVTTYMGKVVTNYKTPNSTETVTIDGTNYTVSTTYRLYYVDFDGKYGEEGTIYLKADCTSNTASVKQSGSKATSKIYDLNPAISTNGPSEELYNMKSSIWLLDTAKWNVLTTASTNNIETNIIKDKVNYVVGAPSLEMMMDSYNTYYGLTGNAPVGMASIELGGERVKLYYRYVNGKAGYDVGPGGFTPTQEVFWAYYEDSGYYTDGDWSSINTTGRAVMPDSSVGTMYCPPDNWMYPLASPCAYEGYDYEAGDVLYRVIGLNNLYDGTEPGGCVRTKRLLRFMEQSVFMPYCFCAEWRTVSIFKLTRM